MAKKLSKEEITEIINKALSILQKIRTNQFGWDITSCIEESYDSLIQARGLINKKT